MTFNSYKAWSEEDIDLLHRLYMEGRSVPHIAKALGRSQAATETAFKNIVVQQLVYDGNHAVSSSYKEKLNIIGDYLGDSKYYVQTNSYSNGVGVVFMMGCLAAAGAYIYYDLLYHGWSNM